MSRVFFVTSLSIRSTFFWAARVDGSKSLSIVPSRLSFASHGTAFPTCSCVDVIISSPLLIGRPLQTISIPSVAFLVKAISSGSHPRSCAADDLISFQSCSVCPVFEIFSSSSIIDFGPRLVRGTPGHICTPQARQQAMSGNCAYDASKKIFSLHRVYPVSSNSMAGFSRPRLETYRISSLNAWLAFLPLMFTRIGFDPFGSRRWSFTAARPSSSRSIVFFTSSCA